MWVVLARLSCWSILCLCACLFPSDTIATYQLSWNPPTFAGGVGVGIVSYNVYWNLTGEVQPCGAALNSCAPPGRGQAAQCFFSKVANPNTPLQFAVKAVNTAGASADIIMSDVVVLNTGTPGTAACIVRYFRFSQ